MRTTCCSTDPFLTVLTMPICKKISTRYEWVDANYLQFNIQKCNFIRVTRKRTGVCPPTLYLCREPMQEVNSYKYLGILLSSDLSWSQHIQSICGKARKLTGLIYRRFYQCSSLESLLQMYISLVRPHLEYASQVWNTYIQDWGNKFPGGCAKICFKNAYKAMEQQL